jgi:predicted RNA-binding protein Jag
MKNEKQTITEQVELAHKLFDDLRSLIDQMDHDQMVTHFPADSFLILKSKWTSKTSETILAQHSGIIIGTKRTILNSIPEQITDLILEDMFSDLSED